MAARETELSTPGLAAAANAGRQRRLLAALLSFKDTDALQNLKNL